MRRELRRLWIRLTRALGVSGTVAIALLIPAIGLAAWMPTFRRDAGDAAALLVVKTQLASHRAQTGTRSISDVELTREFVAGFPILKQNAADIESIFEAAKAHNVALLKGEYQLTLEPSASFVVYAATFPIRSDYGALKDFSADVLKALPHAAMDELRLTRDSAGSTSIDTVVRFTLFYRSH